jgi:class 3 adenylate cyclase/tetratricopeptide (TPR) repeat protein
VVQAGARRERKVVTVVFCDLVGFTARAESLDPEDVEAFLRPYHERVRSELERYGGTVEKFIGDAVMALFGAPTAHEDDPERAVRAALAIRDFAVEEGLELRVGITTGEALVRLDAQPVAGEGMASGDVVNTAARLQSAAPVNGILVNETTARATREAILYEDADPVEAKGKSQPVMVRLALEARARFGVDVVYEARTELVGRERESMMLRDALERALHERIPQLVTLVGVPGIGKSRLVYELSRIVDANPELITWRQGRCLAYGGGITLWALGEIVKAQAGIVEQDAADAVATKIRSSVVDALEGAADQAWVESHLLALVGLGGEPELGGDRRGDAFAAWRRYLEALADRRSLVLVFEDLHWADETLLDFVDELVEWVSDVPLLVVGTARPELLERRPTWGGGKLNATTLAIAPLSEEHTARLLAQLLESPVLDAEAQKTLLERAGGNPLYAEQFADLFVERRSAEGLPLPETLQGIIAARLDGLQQAEKELLRDASVVGKVFWQSSLDNATNETSATLHSLERKGFVRRQRRSSLEGESEFAFAHALVRDVAYGQIARAERAAKHQRVAEWIESLGRPEDHAEMLAHHWGSALELARAAGVDGAALVERTRIALRDAGDRAFGLNAFATAGSYYEDALALWPEDGSRPHLLHRFATSLYLADDDRAEAALAEARNALLELGDREGAAEAEVALSRVWWYRGQSERSTEHATQAQALVEGLSSPTAARVLSTIARARAVGGNPAEALRLAREAFALIDPEEIGELQAHVLSTIGLAKASLGDASGFDDESRALEIAIAANSPFASSIANNVAVNAFCELDLPRADELFQEAMQIALRFGDRTGARWLRAQLTHMLLFLGDWDAALRRLDEFIAECEAGSPHYLQGRSHNWRARIKEGRGDVEGALADVERALSLTDSISDPQARLAELSGAVAMFETHGRIDEARALARELVEGLAVHPPDAGILVSIDIAWTQLAQELDVELRDAVTHAPPWPWTELALSCLDRDYVRAAAIWGEGGSPTWEARLRLRASEELTGRGLLREAGEQAAQALAFYRSVGATFLVERAEQLLAATRAQSESA